MSEDNKIRLPSGQGGLTRYFEDYKTHIQLSPGAVIVLSLAVMAIIIILHYVGDKFFS